MTQEITRPEDITEFPDQIPEVVIRQMRERALTQSNGIIAIDQKEGGEPDMSGRLYWLVRTFGEQLILQLPERDEDGRIKSLPTRKYNLDGTLVPLERPQAA